MRIDVTRIDPPPTQIVINVSHNERAVLKDALSAALLLSSRGDANVSYEKRQMLTKLYEALL